MPPWFHGLVAAAGLSAAGCLEAPSPAGTPPPSDASQVPRTWIDRTGDVIQPALFGPRLTYDSVNGQVLAYGGSLGTDNQQAVPTMMAWNGEEWITLCDDCDPGARVFHGFAFDSRRGRAVLYGGIDELGTRHGDLWEWDGSSWLPLPVPEGTSPGPLSHFWMAYDPERARMVFFGGDTGGGSESNEMFEYDSENWYALGQGSGPGARSDNVAPAVWDPISRRILIYGRWPQGDDLWGWDGDAWSLLCESCTGVERSAASIEVDPARERILIVGGWDPEVTITGTWELYPDGTLACATAAPTARDTAGMARDASRDVIVLYGGNGSGCAGNCSQTLELTFDEGGSDCAPP